MRFPAVSLSPAALEKALRALVILTVPLASFLSFSVQPLVGKLLLPVQGGASSTWLGTMLYFQLALLLGYGWAVWLIRSRALVQVGATVALGAFALLGSRLSWVQESSWTGIGGIVLTLAVSCLPATVLLFSAGPLLHGWLGGKSKPVPYFLYAISNAGSLAAVILYPFTVERAVGLSSQMLVWHGLLGVFVGILGVAGFLYLRSVGPAHTPEKISEFLPLSRIATWLGLSALSCLGMLGATHHLAAEIGSTPLAWVGPFGAFLLSFMATFSGWWRPHYTLACLGWLAVSLTGFMLSKGVSPTTVDGLAAFWTVSLTAACSFFVNGLLHASRPLKNFSLFYLVLAAGGVAGGLFATFGVPFFFLRPSEFLAVSCVLLVLGLVRLLARRGALDVTVVLLVVLAPVVGLAVIQTRNEADGFEQLRRFRNIYGYTLIKTEENGLVLSSETTTHGTQLTVDADARRHPTLYYTESSAVGRLLLETQKTRASLNIGVVGLGAGTLAAYARDTDRVDFWDIDPKALRIATDYFTFINDSPGRINLVQADGRKALESSPVDYDVIVIDAFTGDAVPAHLLTREALAIYTRRLGTRGGLIAIHTSSRYNTLFPIVAATAHSLGLSAAHVVTSIEGPGESIDWDATGSHYILVGRPDLIKTSLDWFPAEEDEGRVQRTVTSYDPLPRGRATVWTDDRHAALDALNLGDYLRAR